MIDKEDFMKAIDEMIEICKKENYVGERIVKILRDIIKLMAEKMYHDRTS